MRKGGVLRKSRIETFTRCGLRGLKTRLRVSEPTALSGRLPDVALERHGARAPARAVARSRLLSYELPSHLLGQIDTRGRTAILVAVRRTLLRFEREGILGILVARTPRKQRELPTTLGRETCSSKGRWHGSSLSFDFYPEGGGTSASGIPVKRRIGWHTLADGNVSAFT